jgi:DNA-binding MarR family transcriptional regulator
MKLGQLTAVIDFLESEYDLDLIDLRLLAVMQMRWEKDEPIRITDLVRDFKIASPATTHYRVSQDLVEKKMIKLRENPEDKRERLIEEGPEFKNIKKFLGDK